MKRNLVITLILPFIFLVAVRADELPPIQESDLNGNDPVAAYWARESGARPGNFPETLKNSTLGLSPSKIPQTETLRSTHPEGGNDRAHKAGDAYTLSNAGVSAAKTAMGLMSGKSFSLLFSSNPVEQKAGYILLNDYVDSYGRNYKDGMMAAEAQQAAADQESANQNWAQNKLLRGEFGQGRKTRVTTEGYVTPDGQLLGGRNSEPQFNIPEDIRSALVNSGVNLDRLQQEINEKDWESVETLISDARNQMLTSDQTEGLARQLATKVRDGIVSHSYGDTDGDSSNEVEKVTLDEESESNTEGIENNPSLKNLPPKTLRLQQTLKTASIGEFAFGPATKPAKAVLLPGQIERVVNPSSYVSNETKAEEVYDLENLENLGVQKLGRGISIFRLAHHKYTQSPIAKK